MQITKKRRDLQFQIGTINLNYQKPSLSLSPIAQPSSQNPLSVVVVPFSAAASEASQRPSPPFGLQKQR